MSKKIISLIIALSVIFGAFSINSFGATDKEIYAGNQLRTLGILMGYEDGTLRLDNNITRGEVAALVVRMLGYGQNKEVPGDDKTFTDLPKNYWGYKEVQKAFRLRVINGYPDDTFKPTNNISYVEVVAIMVNSLGKNQNLEGVWPENYITRGKEIGVIPKDSTVLPDKIVTRGEMAVIMWDTLLVK